jgi:DNA modification methylase/superfamily II DNA or RNA helicase
MNVAYEDFLAAKLVSAKPTGIEASADDLNPVLFDWQREVTAWALQRGRAAVFAACGLGKTFMQVEWAHRIAEATGGRVLILAPLAVAHQTIKEAAKLGITVEYARSQEQATGTLVITNYECLADFDPTAWIGVVLDESSILKSFTGKTKRALLEAFSETPYRLACTATPAPNDHMELGNHADFLGVMASNEMLARWFINDSMKAGNYRLKAHGERDFWRWVSSWAVCAEKPSDLGNYEDGGFALPPLVIQGHLVADPARAHDRGKLFLGDAAPSATEMWADKRETAEDRCVMAYGIVASKPDVPWTIWCETNHEADLLARLLPGSIDVGGSDSLAEKERKLDAFADGEARVICTKSSIAGFGLNWQHCSDVVFVGLTYSFEKLYQAIRRSWRYGQTRPVTVHLISAESDQGIVSAVEAKQAEYDVMVNRMVAATKEFGLGHRKDRRLLAPVETEAFEGEGWEIRLGDNVPHTRAMPDNSVGLTVTSLPFSNLYIYSDSVADMGNSADHREFFQHFDYLAPELFRVTQPGRLCAIHCKDLPLYMNRDGAAGLYDFPADIGRSMTAAGWTFHSRVTIWKDPVTEMQRTKNHGLLHKNFTDRGEVCRQGMADYLLVFRAWKPEQEDRQVQHIPQPGTFIGEKPPESWDSDRDWSIQLWQRYASPVWFDIRQPRVLAIRGSRAEQDEKHICPLQLDVIERCIFLWSNAHDLVFDPYGGIGSTGYVALQTARRSLAVELKRSYVQQAVGHLERAVRDKDQGKLFPDDV